MPAFKLVKDDCKDVPVYGGETLSTGDTIELEGFLAEKAEKNPDFEAVKAKRRKSKAKSATDGDE